MARIALSTALKVARRINLGVPQWPSNKCHRDLSTKVLNLKQWRGTGRWSSQYVHFNPFSTNTGHDFSETGYTDVADLLSLPDRDFLLRNNGEKVPLSSLEGKIVGLYICDNTPHIPSFQAIKKAYEEAKSRGYDFEIVQIINFPDPPPLRCPEDVSWLTLPFHDPCSWRTRIAFEIDIEDHDWDGDCLVLVYQDSTRVVYELAGAEILERWGIEGYPFTRPSLYNAEHELLKREATLQQLFPPGECLLRRPRSTGGGFDLVDGFSQLSGKRFLVWFAPHFDYAGNRYFVPMLKSMYEAQAKDNVEEESKFEVVYVSTGYTDQLEFDEFTKDMPWLVLPLSQCRNHAHGWRILYHDLMHKVFRMSVDTPAAAAFNEQGELIAREGHIVGKEEGHKLQFPFIDQDLDKRIREDVDSLCYVPDFHRQFRHQRRFPHQRLD